jgi:heme/copper-type cytochrome/quinol oxidase subunit 2
VTPDNAWIYAALPFITMAALTVGFVVVFRQRRKTQRALAIARHTERRPNVRWWERPVVPLAIVVVAVVLGSMVWPGLYLLALLAVPSLWRRRPRRTPTVDPRSNGHAHRDGGAFTAE